VVSGVGVLGSLALVFLVAIAAAHPTGSSLAGLACGFVVCLIGVCVCAGLAGGGRASRCPACRRWWARLSVGRALVDQCHAYKTVTRRDSQSGGFAGIARGGLFGGTTWWETKRREQIYVLRKTFENYKQCKFCRHPWVIVTKEDTEDFEVGA
jgi:hypothetical protein